MTDEEPASAAACIPPRPGPSAGSDRSDGTADMIAFAQRFIVIRPDVDDVQGVRFASGRVLADEGGQFIAATCWVHMVERDPAARTRIVWENDQEPRPCCPHAAADDHPPTS